MAEIEHGREAGHLLLTTWHATFDDAREFVEGSLALDAYQGSGMVILNEENFPPLPAGA